MFKKLAGSVATLSIVVSCAGESEQAHRELAAEIPLNGNYSPFLDSDCGPEMISVRWNEVQFFTNGKLHREFKIYKYEVSSGKSAGLPSLMAHAETITAGKRDQWMFVFSQNAEPSLETPPIALFAYDANETEDGEFASEDSGIDSAKPDITSGLVPCGSVDPSLIS